MYLVYAKYKADKTYPPTDEMPYRLYKKEKGKMSFFAFNARYVYTRNAQERSTPYFDFWMPSEGRLLVPVYD